MEPESLFSILSDATRLRALALIQVEGELCVCELTWALRQSQPKISRHLALMRDAGVVEARREGTWMHYRISADLPGWAARTLKRVFEQIGDLDRFEKDRARLHRMSNRPGVPACA